MGSIPVASPSPPQRLSFPRRGIAILVTLVATVGIFTVAAIFAWPSGPKVDQPGWVALGNVDDFPLLEPVAVKNHRLYVVRLDADKFVALSRIDPHRGCVVPFRPDFEFLGRKGWFRDPCSGSTYDVTGRLFAGPSPRSLDRFPARVSAGALEVNVGEIVPGPAPGGPGVDPLNPRQ